MSSIDRFVGGGNIATKTLRDAAEEPSPQIKMSKIKQTKSHQMKFSKRAAEGETIPKAETFIKEMVDYNIDSPDDLEYNGIRKSKN